MRRQALWQAWRMTRAAGFKLLIADDHAPMRQTLRALLAPMAGAIHEAADGGQAVRLFIEQEPDWVVMDVQMKPVNGLAATRAIRSRFPGARIVIVTQYDDADLRAEAARAGAFAYVLKDDLATLTQIISRETASSGGDAPSKP
jgi:DNA-binding NarL/FixJ family response regulator